MVALIMDIPTPKKSMLPKMHVNKSIGIQLLPYRKFKKIFSPPCSTNKSLMIIINHLEILWIKFRKPFSLKLPPVLIRILILLRIVQSSFRIKRLMAQVKTPLRRSNNIESASKRINLRIWSILPISININNIIMILILISLIKSKSI